MFNKKCYPILSICIPTYNRGVLLDKLFNQIFSLSEITKSKIQLCISDNFSSDTTYSVIDAWGKKLKLVTVRQESNIGASRNFQAVARLSTAPWVLLMGDDDLLSVTGLENLLSILETVSSNTWILADISNQDGTTLLANFLPGYWTKREFKKQILFNSLLDSLGFMSMHVIPKDSIHKFTTLSVEQIYGWPHLALLFYDLPNIDIYVQRVCLVKRGGDGEEVTQTWRSNDWLRLMMQKTKLSCFSEKGTNLFSTWLAMREYCGLNFARQTLYSVMVMGSRRGLRCEINDYVDATNIHLLVRLLIKLHAFLLLLFPIGLIAFVRKLRNPTAVELGKLEKNVEETDGMGRGL